MTKLSKNILPLFKEAGWYQGRKIDITPRLTKEFGNYPDSYIDFMSEFIDLDVHKKNTKEFIDITGEKSTLSYDHFISFDLMYNKDLIIDEFNEEGGISYYSKLINDKLYPIGEIDEGFIAATDSNMRLYVFNMGILGCIKVHDDIYAGLECILKNDLYTYSYILEEYGDKTGKWTKRIK